MKARYRVNDRIEFEIEGETQKDIFGTLAQTFEIFGEDCGHCGSKDTYPKVRTTTAKQGKNKGKSFTYYEVACRECGHFLPLGQHNSDAGTLFPDRKVQDTSGELVYDKQYRGWRKSTFRKEEEEGED